MANAERYRTEEAPSELSWDLGFAFGDYDNYPYSELDLGLNDRFAHYFNWRNVAWDRFGNSSTISALGVDSSLRFEFTDHSQTNSSSFRFFAGPGVRVASASFSGYFGEAGVLFRFGGLSLGGGVKAISYFSPGVDPMTGFTMPKADIEYFIILGGGGPL